MIRTTTLDDLLALCWKDTSAPSLMDLAHLLAATRRVLDTRGEDDPSPHVAFGVRGELSNAFGGNQYLMIEDHLDDRGKVRHIAVYACGSAGQRLVAVWRSPGTAYELMYILPGPWMGEVCREAAGKERD